MFRKTLLAALLTTFAVQSAAMAADGFGMQSNDIVKVRDTLTLTPHPHGPVPRPWPRGPIPWPKPKPLPWPGPWCLSCPPPGGFDRIQPQVIDRFDPRVMDHRRFRR